MTSCDRCSHLFVPADDRQKLCNAPECRAFARSIRSRATKQRRRAARSRAREAGR